MSDDNIIEFQRPSEPPPPHEFDELFRRLYVIVNQLDLVETAFNDLGDMPEQYAPAAFITGQVAGDLRALYDELDAWHMRHTHEPKSAASAQS